MKFTPSKKMVMVGRGSVNDVKISGTEASGKHLQILFKEGLGWVVKDTSTNGTLYHVKHAVDFEAVHFSETTPIVLDLNVQKEYNMQIREKFTLKYVSS